MIHGEGKTQNKLTALQQEKDILLPLLKQKDIAKQEWWNEGV
jgi:hypothetical protein